jgi:nicotinate-nucleotide adenylyltransferase
MKTALFGGTFNPIHNGHLIVAEHMRSALSIDTVMFIPSYITPHKQAGEEIVSEHRLEMVRLATHGSAHFRCSDIEINKNEISYTIDTVEELMLRNPNDTMYLIIGMDNYLTFHHWKNPNEILSKIRVVVMNRPHHQKQLNEAIGTKNIIFIDVPNIDISSTEIRKRVQEGKSVSQMVPPAVDDYIRNNGLYT